MSDQPTGQEGIQPEPLSQQLEDACRRFEAAWRAGEAPCIRDYVEGDWSNDQPIPFRLLLEQLVEIDLEYRWRATKEAEAEGNGPLPAAAELPLQPRLADYVARYPALGPLEQISAGLIGQEYYIRCRWGDGADRDEYLDNFGALHSSLAAAIDSQDRELAGQETNARGSPCAESTPPVPDGPPALRCPHCRHVLPAEADRPAKTTCPDCGKDLGRLRPAFHLQLRGVASAAHGKVGRFELVEKLGDGTFGIVWKA